MKKCVLLIEDNEQNRYLATFLLEASGWTVVHAPNGPAGLKLAGEINPAVILLDIQLPGMNGYDVARALRAQAALAAIPIVAVTSFAMAGDRERCLAAGCTGYIEKPIDPENFAAEVAHYLGAAE